MTDFANLNLENMNSRPVFESVAAQNTYLGVINYFDDENTVFVVQVGTCRFAPEYEEYVADIGGIVASRLKLIASQESGFLEDGIVLQAPFETTTFDRFEDAMKFLFEQATRLAAAVIEV